MIKWNLNEVMAKKRISNRKLAKLIQVHENSVYRLRKTDIMPRLTAEKLNSLCQALDCTPSDLIDYIPD